MMATGDYCTLGELKLRIWPDGTAPDNDNDVMLQSIITAVSRTIDNYCGRRFYTTAADETRTFTAEDEEMVFPDVDIVSVTELKTDEDGDRTYETTWSDDDYELMPPNAALHSEPYMWIVTTPMGGGSFPVHRNGVQITGKFGRSSVPSAVKEATIIQAMRIWQRRNAPFGIISNPAGGDMRLLDSLDPDIEVLLARYRRLK